MPTNGAWRIRRAEPAEAGGLEGLQQRSSAHWGYPPGYFDWAGDALAIPDAYVRNNPVFVLRTGVPETEPVRGRAVVAFGGRPCPARTIRPSGRGSVAGPGPGASVTCCSWRLHCA
ncbi:hypothetical protein [Streptomyces xanthophaeus]|uniref:hypothetical protein n=1 Tax=Streptomyces xanthophaeus TaxID=67385 RepID=UPI00371E6D61